MFICCHNLRLREFGIIKPICKYDKVHHAFDKFALYMCIYFSSKLPTDLNIPIIICRFFSPQFRFLFVCWYWIFILCVIFYLPTMCVIYKKLLLNLESLIITNTNAYNHIQIILLFNVTNNDKLFFFCYVYMNCIIFCICVFCIKFCNETYQLSISIIYITKRVLWFYDLIGALNNW